MEVDLRTVVRYQVPVLLEKLLYSPAFITGPPPIQLIRVLCRHFLETVRIIILFLYDLDSICFIISIEHKL
ncbi:unnamed protein product, partial [Adineta steineri]